jgi:Cys-tRNA(Pro)/Cys-tRNA(Cys) deacylase
MRTTQAMRMLDARGIAYVAREYDPTGAFHSGEEAAALVGAPPALVYKTLVVLRDGDARSRPMLVMVPSDRELDLRRFAEGIGAKRARMASQREAERLTGMQAGGISALALAGRAFDVYIDGAARDVPRVHVSAGVRGVDLAIAVADLVAVTGARFTPASA